MRPESPILRPKGGKIKVEIAPEKNKKGAASHTVYRLLSVKSNGHEKFSLAKVERHDSLRFSGKVAQLNYALHGEVNGGILNTGEFLHLKPHGAAVLDLALGMKLSGKGSLKPMLGSHRVIEAEEVNGVKLEKKPKKKATK